MSEKTLMAYFSTEEAAEKAINQLKSMGYETVQKDSFSMYPGGESAEESFNPLTGDYRQSLTALVQGLEQSSEDVRTLVAANPTSYSMADNSQMITGENHLITVVCEAEQAEAARQVLKQLGGNI